MKSALVLLGLLQLTVIALAGWKLEWNDEFNGNYLDSSKWDIEVNCWGGGNLEKQCYTSRRENVFVSGGSLHLRPVRGTYQGSNQGCTLNNENSCTWTQPATSGRVRTLKAFNGSWKYGRFEARAKLPKGNFLWPAFWMLPTDNIYGGWAASGEFDIMESRGQNPTKVSSALHFGGQWPNNKFTSSGDKDFGFDFTADFHIFAMEWNSKDIKFYVDNKLTWTQSLEKSYGSIYPRNGAPFDQKFHILLNVAIAGGFFDPAKYGQFDINTAGPTWTQAYQIDYVRVYKWV
ncbi:glucan endo-1,3-beta-glucosidase-like isoform X3 [Leptopilina boulardi]|nr:glucan endo-1,3-beta-glucosidase-like isoform X3 [Leptopilina boulardi]XP_051170433.1 glucan endo-1,3-beta-glucosidase-like isoform X3 [Leptopilina boulardi]